MVFGRPDSFSDDFEREFEEMSRMMDRMFNRMRGSDWTRIPAGKPLYYGVSVNVGPDGVPHVQEFGNVRPGQAQLSAGVREPFCTSLVDEEKHQLKVTAEMPGVDKERVKVQVRDDALEIQAEGDDRTYAKTLPLERPVDQDSAKARYNNGVLEVTLDLAAPKQPKGKDVPVE